MSRVEAVSAEQAARVGVGIAGVEQMRWSTLWTCEKWSEDACDHVRRKLGLAPQAEVSSALLRTLIPVPDLGVEERPGNLLLNEGIQRMLDLLIGAAGVAFNNANAFIGVGDTATAAAATQTELAAAALAANRFYKGMVAGFPARTNQTVDFRSDFASAEANFTWSEWTIAAGATGASGAGFLTGTTNLNRKVESLGGKVTGVWTLTLSVTLS